jgi:hypothetical protein
MQVLEGLLAILTEVYHGLSQSVQETAKTEPQLGHELFIQC